MEFLLGGLGVVAGLAVTFFFLWISAAERADDAESLCEILLEHNKALEKSNEDMRNRVWRVANGLQEFESKGGAENALTEGRF
jgi:hypothetical protein